MVLANILAALLRLVAGHLIHGGFNREAGLRCVCTLGKQHCRETQPSDNALVKAG